MHIEGLKALPARDIPQGKIVCYSHYADPQFGLIVSENDVKYILFLTPPDARNASGGNLSRADAFGEGPLFVFPHAAVVPYFGLEATSWSQPSRGSIALVGERLVCLGHRHFDYVFFNAETGEHVPRTQATEVYLHAWDILVRDSHDDLHSVLKIRGGKVGD